MKIFKFVLITVLLYGCQSDHASSTKDSKFSPSVGGLITIEVAARWMKFYDVSGAKVQSCSVSPKNFKSLMATNDKVGIALHYAKDDANTKHILLIPVGETELIYDGAVILDANTDMVISSEVAKAWIENYKTSNPGDIWYHYFGIEVFEDISTTDFSRFEIAPAVNDKGERQLLLLVWPNPNGRTKEASPLVYDMSNPCPPCPR